MSESSPEPSAPASIQPPHVLLVRQPDGNVQVQTNCTPGVATWLCVIGQTLCAQQGLPKPPAILPSSNGHGMREF